MKVRCSLDIPDSIIQQLITDAVRRGFMREEPKKKWSEKEFKQAICFLCQTLLQGR